VKFTKDRNKIVEFLLKIRVREKKVGHRSRVVELISWLKDLNVL
jgi:hypothetical protein